MRRKTLDLTLGFLKSLERAINAEEVCGLLLQALEPYGVVHIVSGTVPNPGTPSIRQPAHILLNNTPPEWAARYFTRGYAFADPTVRQIHFDQGPFTWDHAAARYGDTDKARLVMSEAAEFGLCRGVTVPLLTLDAQLAGGSFSGRHMETDPVAVDAMHLMAIYSFAHLLLLQERETAASTVRLTPREREVLQWCAEGKSASDIGDVLKISEKGVEHHLRSVRIKLNTLNSVQSVAVGIRRGLIS